MALDDIGGDDSKGSNKWIGVYIGVLAVLLAICSMGGGNAAKDASRANLDASNLWAFFQAKNIRRTTFILAADEMEALLKTQPGLTEEARKHVEGKIKLYRDTAARYKTEPKSKEGLDELFVRAKALEVERDTAMRKDPYFDWSQALLQIAIVLASVAIISGSGVLLFVSGTLGVVGSLLMLNGFLLLVKVPLLG
ncbi:MAG: DUF4337 domain-containing protein [Hyphomicrobiaceae bacterium]|nr:DUF4337 domain-containing protein [Hyphomicrobiaceae bacterium]